MRWSLDPPEERPHHAVSSFAKPPLLPTRRLFLLFFLWRGRKYLTHHLGDCLAACCRVWGIAPKDHLCRRRLCVRRSVPLIAIDDGGWALPSRTRCYSTHRADQIMPIRVGDCLACDVGRGSHAPGCETPRENVFASGCMFAGRRDADGCRCRAAVPDRRGISPNKLEPTTTVE